MISDVIAGIMAQLDLTDGINRVMTSDVIAGIMAKLDFTDGRCPTS